MIKKRRRKLKLVSFLTKIFLAIFVFFLAIYLGIKILVNLLYLSSKLLPEKPQEKIQKANTPSFKPNLTILSLPEATNEAVIKANVFAENTEEIKIYLNDKLENKLKVEDENLEITIDNLQPGKNVIYFIAQIDKNTTKTKDYTVLYDNTPPKIEILSPKESEVNKNEIVIKGKTEPKVIIKINSEPVVVSQNGEFSKTVRLKDGENKITITAEDEAGNKSKKELTVIKTS